MGGVFSCVYTIAHVFKRWCEIFVCGRISAILRCANIILGALFFVHVNLVVPF